MLLERLDIDVYGPFGKKTVGSFSNGINAIWGPEGSGKTAIIDFIRGVMLGGEFSRFGSTVGRVTWADHRGMYHCQRETDGTREGRLTTDFSPRDATYADERFRHYGYHARRPETIPPALLDLVVAPDSRETSIAAIFEAAAAVGFQQALCASRDTEDIERVRQRLTDIDAQLDRDYRGSECRDDLEMRRRRLTTELETLERDARGISPDLRRGDRRQLEDTLARARSEADRIRYVQEDLRQSIADVEHELEALHHHETAQSPVISEAVRRELELLDTQLSHWRVTLQQITALGERLASENEEHLTGNAGLESQLDDAFRQVDALLSRHTNYATTTVGKQALDRHLRNLKDGIHRVRETLGRSVLRASRMSDAARELRQCEEELYGGMERLIVQRSDWMRQASNEHNIPFERLAQAFGDWSPYLETPNLRQWLVSEQLPPQVGTQESSTTREQRMRTELTQLQAELVSSDDRLSEVVREIDVLQREQAALPHYRPPVVDSERMGHLRIELAEVRRRLDWIDSRDGLRRERDRLSDELRRLEAEGQQTESPLTACANHWLSRLTAGRLRSLELVQRDEVRVDGRRETDISTDDRRAAGLALRMAICCLLNENRTGIPIVIDDPVIYEHDHRCVARTLSEFAAGGNQVVVLTRSQPLVDSLSDQGAWTDALPARANLASGSEGDLYDVNRYLDMAWRESNGLYDNPKRGVHAGWNPSYDYPRKRTQRGYYEPKHRAGGSSEMQGDEGNSRFFLTPESHVDLAPSIDSVAAARLRGIGCESVGDLLTSEPANIASRLGLAGVSAATVRRWQVEADMVCRVPGLRAFDARILVGCGVTRPEQLRHLDPTQLLDKVERFLSSDLGRETLRSGTAFELSRLTTWIASASRVLLRGTGKKTRKKQSAEQTTKRTTRRRRVTRQAGDATSNPMVPYGPHQDDYHPDQASGYSYREEIDYDGDGIPDETIEYEYDESGNRVSRHTRRSLSGGQSQESSGKSSRRVKRTRKSRQRSVVSISESNSRGLRFFLTYEQPVVDAPSIGPRKAEALNKVGVITVEDLLSEDPEALAERLGHRRVDAETVLAWQQQTELVCSVPMLRGHDAQLLVAAGVTDAETLAESDAESLLALVDPIARSSEGKRILRGGSLPDDQEIRDWISWAQQRDQVQAA